MNIETMIRDAAAATADSAPERTLQWRDIEARIVRRRSIRPFFFAAGGIATAAAAVIGFVVASKISSGPGQIIPAFAPTTKPSVVQTLTLGDSKLEWIAFAAGQSNGKTWHFLMQRITEKGQPAPRACTQLEMAILGVKPKMTVAGDSDSYCPGDALSATATTLLGVSGQFLFGGVVRGTTRIRVEVEGNRTYETTSISASDFLPHDLWMVLLPSNVKPKRVIAFDITNAVVGEYQFEDLNEATASGEATMTFAP